MTLITRIHLFLYYVFIMLCCLTGRVSSTSCVMWKHIMKRAKHMCKEFEDCTSQGGQDRILNATFNYIGVTNQQCVEFGFGYGKQKMLDVLTIETLAKGSKVFSGLNTQGLMRNGFKATFFDAVLSAPHVGIVKSVLTRENIGDSFKAAGIPMEVDYVSIDVDSIDVWLLLGMLESGYRPRVFSVEFNCNFAFDEHITCVQEWSKWDETLIYGASAGAINTVANKYGYTLVHVEGHLDVFFVRNDILKNKGCIVPAAEILYDGMTKRLHKLAKSKVANKRLVDFDLAYEGKLEEAHSKAMEILRKAPIRVKHRERFSLLADR